MVTEATRIRRLKRSWIFSSLMFFVGMALFATAPHLYDPLAIFAFVHGCGWGLFAGMTRTEIEQLQEGRIQLATEDRRRAG